MNEISRALFRRPIPPGQRALQNRPQIIRIHERVIALEYCPHHLCGDREACVRIARDQPVDALPQRMLHSKPSTGEFACATEQREDLRIFKPGNQRQPAERSQFLGARRRVGLGADHCKPPVPEAE